MRGIVHRSALPSRHFAILARATRPKLSIRRHVLVQRLILNPRIDHSRNYSPAKQQRLRAQSFDIDRTSETPAEVELAFHSSPTFDARPRVTLTLPTNHQVLAESQ
jgi:hypothetical protein